MFHRLRGFTVALFGLFVFSMTRLLLTILVIVALLVVVAPSFAQEAPSDPPVAAPDDPETGTLLTAEDSTRLLEDAFTSIKLGVVGSPLVMLIVQILKFIPVQPFTKLKATDLAAGAGLILVILGAVANGTGYGQTFDTATMFAQNVFPHIVAVITLVVGSAVTHQGLQRVGAGDSALARSRSSPLQTTIIDNAVSAQ